MKDKKNLVVKTNRLIRAIQRLSIQEIRLVQLAIVEGREKDAFYNPDGSIRGIRVDASAYAEMFELNRHAAYKQLLEAEKRLFGRYFHILDQEYNAERKVAWIQDVLYLKDESSVQITFSQQLVKEVTRLDGLEVLFTQYALHQTASLNSEYSIRLYEILASWRNHKGQTELFELEQFRAQLGLGVNEYQRMSDFKRRVLDFAVDEINEKTDLKVSYEQQKQGRKIVGFKFKVGSNQKRTAGQVNDKRDQNTPDLFSPFHMTDSQISTFARRLAALPEIATNAPVGMSQDDFIQKIANDLLDPTKRLEYKPYLNELDFKFYEKKENEK